jgi:hypothetical protein
MLLLENAPHSRRRSSDQSNQGDQECLALMSADPCAFGTDYVIRHREVGQRFSVLARGARTQLYKATPKLAVWSNQAVQQRHSAAVGEFRLAQSKKFGE